MKKNQVSTWFSRLIVHPVNHRVTFAASRKFKFARRQPEQCPDGGSWSWVQS